MFINTVTKKYFKECEEQINMLNGYIINLTTIANNLVYPLKEDETIIPHIVWKYEMYNTISIHRILDLLFSTNKSWNEEHIPSCFLSTRAIQENVAYMYDMCIRLNKIVENKEFDKINETIENRLFGTKLDDEYPTIMNVLTAIDKTTEDFSVFRTLYNDLSEYCHPNKKAMIDLYIKMDKYPAAYVDKSIAIDGFVLGKILSGLNISMVVLDVAIKKIDEIYPILIKVCNEQFEKPNTDSSETK